MAEEHGHDSISSLLSAARRGHRMLQDQVVEAMTINETSFFRDVHPFRALSGTIIPELLRPGPRSLRMWSAATSTGQEAYSLAILMAENFPNAPEPAVLGTDIAEAVLQRARAGEYTQLEVNRGLPARSLVRHFQQEGRTWRIKPEFKRVVRFHRLNLGDTWPAMPAMDVILLRNVLIYFDDRTRTNVIERAVAALRPGGYLLVGSAETLMVRTDAVDRLTVGATICFRARG